MFNMLLPGLDFYSIHVWLFIFNTDSFIYYLIVFIYYLIVFIYYLIVFFFQISG